MILALSKPGAVSSDELGVDGCQHTSGVKIDKSTLKAKEELTGDIKIKDASAIELPYDSEPGAKSSSRPGGGDDRHGGDIDFQSDTLEAKEEMSEDFRKNGVSNTELPCDTEPCTVSSSRPDGFKDWNASNAKFDSIDLEALEIGDHDRDGVTEDVNMKDTGYMTESGTASSDTSRASEDPRPVMNLECG